ncbi:MAG TPA: hypothetical protein VHB68_07370 [Steroidobacteraceae bacterium]|nr:hypothetical protein [Steroidobacteraceae bacterium]
MSRGARRASLEVCRELWRERTLIGSAFATAIGVGYLPLLVLPWTIGALLAATGRSESWAGWMATAEIGSLALGSLAASRYAAMRGRRWIAAGGLAMALVANIVSAFVAPGSVTFLAARVASGAGFGACVAVGNATAAGSVNPTRAFATVWFLMALWQPVIFAATPWAISEAGLRGAYELIACAALILAPLVVRIPDPRPGASVAAAAARPGGRRVFAVLILAAFLLFWLREALVYSMSERLAAAQGLSGRQLGTILGVASVVGLVGPVFAARVGNSTPSPALLCIGLLTAFGTSVVMAIGFSGWVFGAAALLAPAASFFGASLLSGLAGGVDSSGRLAALGAGAGLLSEAVGPVAGGSLVALGGVGALAATVLAIGIAGAFSGTAAAVVARR